MIFFPPLYHDELLYSAFARYHHQSGNENCKHTMDDLFGSNSVCASVLFPAHLFRLRERMPPGIAIKPHNIIREHSFLPYYTPFIPKERNDQIAKLMELGNGTSIFMKLGRPAFTVKRPQQLQYCENCVEEDRALNGQAYWHRTHQAEGVFLCPTHLVKLEQSVVSVREQRNKHKFITLEQALEMRDNNKISNEIHSNEHFEFIAQQTYNLLNTRINSLGLQEINQYYISRLQRCDLATTSGRIRWMELIPRFIQFYGKEQLLLLNSYIDVNYKATWLHKLLQKPRVSCHPLRHILMLGFLNEDLKSMVDTITVNNAYYSPFGQGPWLCLNPTSNHYKKPVILECKITRCSDTRKPVGTFACNCGFVYSRRGPDKKSDDQFKIGRVKSYGRVWELKLQELSQSNISLREKAALLGCDPQTFKSKLNGTKDKIKNSSYRLKEEPYRIKWLDLIENNVGTSITEVRNLAPSIYSWLYKYDREWLLNHSPFNPTKMRDGAGRVNWAERDEVLVSEIEDAVSAILNEGHDKLVRVSKNEIGRRIGKPTFLRKNLNKLPLTQQRLNVLVETTQQFQARRIKQRAFVLEQTQLVLSEWEIFRAAGIRKEYHKYHEALISDIIMHRNKLNITWG